MRYFVFVIGLSAAFWIPNRSQGLVWSGLTLEFTKRDGQDPATVQDRITDSVVLTRSNDGGGLFNAVEETGYDRFGGTSPAGTLWAFPHNNPGKQISAVNWQDLTFSPWLAAFGGNSTGGPPSTIGQPAVLHILAEDIYLDLQLTAWTQRPGGGFAYRRATGASAGDYHPDGRVDLRDYSVWSDSFGSIDTMADGNQDQFVDTADFTVWRDRATVSSPRHNPHVPEADAWTIGLSLIACIGTILHARRRSKSIDPCPARTTAGPGA